MLARFKVTRLAACGCQLRQFAAAGDGANADVSKVGFIGVGNMGSRMAANLIAGGQKLVVHDRSISALENFCKGEADAEAASSPQEVAESEGVDVLFTALPTPESLVKVYTGREGILAAEGGVRPSLLIDLSTVGPTAARQVAEAARKARLHHHSRPFPGLSVASPTFLDSPVSGGVPAAKAATLTFMAGGDEAAVKAAEPFLKQIGRRVVHVGPAGAGQAAKLANNLALAVQMASVAEALALGTRLGLDPRLLAEVLNSSSGRCWSGDSYNPYPGITPGAPASKGYKGGFSNKMMLKDLRLALDAARESGAVTPMGQQILQLYEQIAKDDMAAADDFSSIFLHAYGGAQEPAPDGSTN